MGSFKQFRRRHKLNRQALISLPQRAVLSLLPARWKCHVEHVLRYRSVHGGFCLLLKPKTFNQKIFYKLIYDRRPLLATFADKLQAREYVRQKIGGELLVDLLAVAERPEEIQWEQLPSRFVLKSNHGSGHVRIVKDKSKENESELRELCENWLGQNYGEISQEWAYKNIRPKIMVENFLDGGNGEVARDYKFFVFNGRVFMIEVDMDRYIDHRRDLFTPDWKRLDVRYRVPNAVTPVAKPADLERMLKIAEQLGEETDFIRVDLYEVSGRVFFGELTNYPLGGSKPFDPKGFDAVLGAQWRMGDYY